MIGYTGRLVESILENTSFMLHAVIIAGGSGTRLWPESRESKAKQFLSFESDQTMIAATVRRLDPLVSIDRVCVVTGRSMVDNVRTSLPDLDSERILGEPAARNTAPCIGLAAVRLLHDDPDATMIVLPADHIIRPEDVFRNTLQFAAELVEESPDRLITLGVKPTFPSTSYGYIQRNARLHSPVAEKWKFLTTPYHVVRFHEKPPVETAEKFLADGNFGWNAGIFVWKAKTILELLQHFEPDIAERLDRIAQSIETPQYAAVLDEQFPLMKKISIDYAVMERADAIMMLDATFEWDDVGTWCSLDRIYSDHHDAAENLAVGPKLLAINSSGCVVRGSDPQHLFALLGLEDLIVVQTADATLIARKDQEESVRRVIDELRKRDWNEYL